MHYITCPYCPCANSSLVWNVCKRPRRWNIVCVNSPPASPWQKFGHSSLGFRPLTQLLLFQLMTVSQPAYESLAPFHYNWLNICWHMQSCWLCKCTSTNWCCFESKYCFHLYIFFFCLWIYKKENKYVFENILTLKVLSHALKTFGKYCK